MKELVRMVVVMQMIIISMYDKKKRPAEAGRVGEGYTERVSETRTASPCRRAKGSSRAA